jgi:hypothetical protein
MAQHRIQATMTRYASIAHIFSWLWLLVGLGACQSLDAQQQLATNHAQAGTQVAQVRLSATVQAARARTTVDFVQTRAVVAATRSQLYELTLVSAGTDQAYLATNRARIMGVRATATALPTIATEPADQTTAPQSPVVDAAAPDQAPTLPAVTPFEMLVTPTPSHTPRPTRDPNAPQIGTPRLATSAGDDDCGAGFASQFPVSTPEIYVILPVTQAPVNTVFEARWLRDGEPVTGIFSYVPDFTIDASCIWFFIDQSDFTFTAGRYSVIIDINGVQARDPITFTLVE